MTSFPAGVSLSCGCNQLLKGCLSAALGAEAEAEEASWLLSLLLTAVQSVSASFVQPFHVLAAGDA